MSNIKKYENFINDLSDDPTDYETINRFREQMMRDFRRNMDNPNINDENRFRHSNAPPPMFVEKPPYIGIWEDISKFCDDDVKKRYHKYIYQYLENMFK